MHIQDVIRGVDSYLIQTKVSNKADSFRVTCHDSRTYLSIQIPGCFLPPPSPGSSGKVWQPKGQWIECGLSDVTMGKTIVPEYNSDLLAKKGEEIGCHSITISSNKRKS